ncbi:MAG: hypothetical protein JWN30_1070 [Bacilli bacterium]|nr:hypothetical protein [Bacilli bacterium]
MTQWEQLLTTVINNVIGSLPKLIRNGFQSGSVDIPPYTNILLPDVVQYDTGQKSVLCPILYHPVDSTRLSLSNSRLNGMDTISAYGPVSFPIQDVSLSVPLILEDVVLEGNWTTYSQCQKGSASPIETIHSGSFVLHFTDIQFTVNIDLDPNAMTATSVNLKLTDVNQLWSNQPVFDATKDLTYDSRTSEGQKTVLAAVLNSEPIRKKYRESARKGIENNTLSDEMIKIINTLLAQLG